MQPSQGERTQDQQPQSPLNVLTDFYWLNFSNAGRRDVEPEIAEVYADVDTGEHDDSPADRAKTFHGLTLSLAIDQGLINGGEEPEQIIVQGQYLHDDAVEEYDPHVHFCERNYLPYDPQQGDPRKLLRGEGRTDNAGNKLFAINDYLTQTCKPVEKWKHAGIETPTRDHAVPKLLKKWDEYKKNPPIDGIDRRLFEHGDYVDMAYHAGLTPDASVLFIDEFQDLAPVEYRLYKQWRDSPGIERVYIAGDPNQSLYSFRGGTPVYFEGTDVDEHIELKDSYRCPKTIAGVGRSILSAHREIDPRGFAGIMTADAVERALPEYDTAAEMIRNLQIASWKRDALYNAVEAPASIDAGEVKVGTMHTAKGLEAPAVFLFTRTTESMVERYRRSDKEAKEEHRAYYVGATRASEELQLIDGFFDGTIAPPIERARDTVGELSR